MSRTKTFLTVIYTFRKYLEAFWPAILWAALIFYLSTRAKVKVPLSFDKLFEWDKLGHALFYFILALTMFWGLRKIGNVEIVAITIVVLVCIVYGISLEYVQFYFFPGRFFEVYDMIANISGVLLSLLLLNYFIK